MKAFLAVERHGSLSRIDGHAARLAGLLLQRTMKALDGAAGRVLAFYALYNECDDNRRFHNATQLNPDSKSNRTKPRKRKLN
jgi:hypothetical protein